MASISQYVSSDCSLVSYYTARAASLARKAFNNLEVARGCKIRLFPSRCDLYDGQLPVNEVCGATICSRTVMYFMYLLLQSAPGDFGAPLALLAPDGGLFIAVVWFSSYFLSLCVQVLTNNHRSLRRLLLFCRTRFPVRSTTDALLWALRRQHGGAARDAVAGGA